MKSLNKTNLSFVVIASLVVILSACGKKADPVPFGGVIQLDPTSVTVAFVDDTCEDMDAIVTYQDGTPAPQIGVTITGAFAEPRNITNTTTRYQFYNAPGCNLAGATGDAINSGFQGVTNDRGVYSFSFLLYSVVSGTTNAFSDNITVRSGSAFASAAVKAN